MIGDIRYWWDGDAAVLSIAESDEYVTAFYWGMEGVPLGVKMMERRFFERHPEVAA